MEKVCGYKAKSGRLYETPEQAMYADSYSEFSASKVKLFQLMLGLTTRRIGNGYGSEIDVKNEYNLALDDIKAVHVMTGLILNKEKELEALLPKNLDERGIVKEVPKPLGWFEKLFWII